MRNLLVVMSQVELRDPVIRIEHFIRVREDNARYFAVSRGLRL